MGKHGKPTGFAKMKHNQIAFANFIPKVFVTPCAD
jgi:hypothetical protein